MSPLRERLFNLPTVSTVARLACTLIAMLLENFSSSSLAILFSKSGGPRRRSALVAASLYNSVYVKTRQRRGVALAIAPQADLLRLNALQRGTRFRLFGAKARVAVDTGIVGREVGRVRDGGSTV